MIEVFYTPKFIRDFKVLPEGLQKEIVEKIELFTKRENHKVLKVHKLGGQLEGRYSFSVNYEYRIIFQFQNSKKVIFYRVGNHDVYK